MSAEYIQRLAGYYGDLLKQIRSAATRWAFNFRAKGAAYDWLDLSLLQEEERVGSGDGTARFSEPRAADPGPGAQPVAAVDVETVPEATTETQAFEKLLRIYQAYTANPYERELLYGYGVLVGSDGRGTQICAPLLLAPARIEFDASKPAVDLALATDEFAVNAALCAEFCDEPRFLEDKVFTAAPTVPVADEEMAKFVNALRAGIPSIKLEGPWTRTLTPVREHRAQARELRVIPAAVLLLVGRSHYYMLKDLEDLAKDPREGDSVLPAFWKEPPAPLPDEDAESLALENYVFPFASNAAQRLAASALERGRVVVVQGPPGTGKSQTICNIVCNLVAHGKSVLVSSQKNKALEVVAEKLQALQAKYLSLTLLKDDNESKRELAESIDALDDHLQGFSGEKLAKAEDRLLGQLEDVRAMAKAAREEFKRVQAVEREMAETARRYHELRGFDVVPATDTVVEGAEAALKRWAALLAQCRPHLDALEAWSRTDPRPGAEVAALARKALELGRRESQLGSDPAVRAKKEALARDAHLTAARVDACLGQWGAVTQAAEAAFAAHAKLESLPDPVTWIGAARDLGARTGADVDRLVEELSVADARARDAIARRAQKDLLAPEKRDRREAIAHALATFAAKRKQFLACLDGEFRKSRALLRTVCDIESATAIANLETWTLYWAARSGVSTHLGALPAELRLNELFAAVDNGRLDAWETAVAQRRAVLDVATSERTLGRALAQLPRPVVTHPELVACADWAAAKALLETARKALEAMKLASERAAIGNVPLVEPVIDLLPAMHELRTLEAGPVRPLLGTCAWLRANPASAEHIDKIVEAARLKARLKASMAECPTSTEELATRMRERREKLLKLSRDLLTVKINRRLFEGARTKKVANDVQFFRKSIRRGKKNYRKFEELKTEFDFTTLLQLFPCWVMGLEDVARVFPLAPGLFDVVIVDEASQCHLMGALPVLYRAKKVMVVGDEKQLPNADVMFLQDAVADELARRHGVSSIPRWEVFDGKRSSLLDMATVFCDRRPFLNEHFRSWPEIIRFANERFYQGRLRITTDSASNPYGPILNLVHVPDADDDPDRKMNEKEAARICDDLIRKMEERKFQKLSFGVLSLFREQTLLIERMLQERLLHRPDVWERHKLIVDTVDGFQGDERDVIFYSFRYGPSSSPNIFTIERDERRINVAFTRARRQVHCYVSRNVGEFPPGNVRDFLVYVGGEGRETLVQPREKGTDPLALDLFARLRSRGVEAVPKYSACGFRIDLVVSGGEKRIAVEVDGDLPHADDLGQAEVDDLERQEILERAGWTVTRMPARAYWLDPEAAADRVAAATSPKSQVPSPKSGEAAS